MASSTVGPSTGLTISGNGTASVTLTGGLTALNSDLASLVYTPTSGFNGTDWRRTLTDTDTADGQMTGMVSVTITVNPKPSPTLGSQCPSAL